MWHDGWHTVGGLRRSKDGCAWAGGVSRRGRQMCKWAAAGYLRDISPHRRGRHVRTGSGRMPAGRRCTSPQPAGASGQRPDACRPVECSTYPSRALPYCIPPCPAALCPAVFPRLPHFPHCIPPRGPCPLFARCAAQKSTAYDNIISGAVCKFCKNKGAARAEDGKIARYHSSVRCRGATFLNACSGECGRSPPLPAGQAPPFSLQTGRDSRSACLSGCRMRKRSCRPRAGRAPLREGSLSWPGIRRS